MEIGAARFLLQLIALCALFLSILGVQKNQR
jgi:hypothetical protein